MAQETAPACQARRHPKVSERTSPGGTSARSVNQKLSCLRHFYQFLLDGEEIPKDPTRAIVAPKQEKKVARAISLVDLEKMVDSVGTSTPLELRDRAMLLLFFASGLRANEMRSLQLRDIDLENSLLRVWQGKGAKDGIAPLNPVAIAAIREYLEKGRPQIDPKGECSYLLVGIWGGWTRWGKWGESEGAHAQQLTRQEIYKRVAEISKRALGRRVSPHRLRAGCATALLEGGSDIRDTQQVMRHASIDTTQIYLDITLGFIRKAYYQFHPLERANEEASRAVSNIP